MVAEVEVLVMAQAMKVEATAVARVVNSVDVGMMEVEVVPTQKSASLRS